MMGDLGGESGDWLGLYELLAKTHFFTIVKLSTVLYLYSIILLTEIISQGNKALSELAKTQIREVECANSGM